MLSMSACSNLFLPLTFLYCMGKLSFTEKEFDIVADSCWNVVVKFSAAVSVTIVDFIQVLF